MEDRIQEFVIWFKGNKPKTHLRKHWRNEELLKIEKEFNARAMNKLDNLLGGDKYSQKELEEDIFCLKNRVEQASYRSDFFPVYMPFVALGGAILISVFGLLAQDFTRSPSILVSIIVFVVAFFCIQARLDSRRNMSDSRVIISFLEKYKDTMPN